MPVRNDASEAQLAEQRRWMVEHDLRRRGIRDERVLAVMSRVPRHTFVPEESMRRAYFDHPLPIGEGQTISQPYIVALMSEALELSGVERVLELGTGSGYQTAILAELSSEVWTIERSSDLHSSASTRLLAAGYARVRCVEGDGTAGLASEAPFDCILATGSLPSISDLLLGQLRAGGVFVGPIGHLTEQRLLRITYHPRGSKTDDLGACRFVPLIGAAGWQEEPQGKDRLR
ncbi:MAG: protein-L-isoaspartate(D-aspartate) O-methyltransferase [Candidatus Bipolaricaulia bacterium]